jgi:hypothetical protein
MATTSPTDTQPLLGHQQPCAPDSANIIRFRYRIGPAALVIGAVTVIAGMALHPTGDNEAALMPYISTHLARWGWTHIILATGFVTLALGMCSVPRLATGPRATRLIIVSAVSGTVGSVLFAWETVAHAAVMQAVASRRLPPDQALQVAKHYVQSAYFFPFSAAASLFLPLGLLLLGIAMIRSRRIPTWAAVVLTLSPVGVQAGGAAGPRMLLAGLPLIVGCTALARAVQQTRGHVDT